MNGEVRDPSVLPCLGVVAENGPGIGAGHLARCLALTEAWCARNGRAEILLGSGFPEEWAERYRVAGASLVPSFGDLDVAVVDGYGLSPDLPGRLRKKARVLVIDDGGRRRTYDADWVLDQNFGASPAPYGDVAEGCGLLLGAEFTLLRKEVTSARPELRPDRRQPPQRLLVSLGADPSPALRELAARVIDSPSVRQLGMDVVPLAGVADVGSTLASVDMALAAAGSTIWELCAVGVPTVTFCVADNQEVVARPAGDAGLVIDAGDLKNLEAGELASDLVDLVNDSDRRDRISAAAWSAIDGRGPDRVATVVRSGLVRYRRAGVGDKLLLWEWTNDPDTRRVSFYPEQVLLEDHERWLAAKLESPESIIWIASDHRGAPLGQIRIDRSEDDRRVGRLAYSIAKEQRGSGWAAAMLVGAVQLCFAADELPWLNSIEALVLEENEASWRSLAAAGFARVGDGSDSEHIWRTYRIDRPSPVR